MTAIFDLTEARRVQGFWYLGTPYTNYPGGLNEAFELAACLTGVLSALELDVYSPIAHCHPVALHGGIDPRKGRFWMLRTAPVRRASCGLIVAELASWQESEGLTAEREEYSREGKPVYHLNRVALRRLIGTLRG